jgi:enediyne biosynthesis protein E4
LLNRAGSEAIGALATLEVGSKRYCQQVQPNQSYCSSNDPRLHYGLGPLSAVDRLRVHWPGGVDEVFGPFQADQIYHLHEGQGTAVTGARPAP